MNPFEILGLPITLELDDADLEARYLRLSRDYHPDFNQRLPADQQLEMLRRSARLNDAYRALRNPWSRAEAAILAIDPDAMEATKTLCPMFLLTAMEAREEVDDATAADWDRLHQEVQANIDNYFAEVAKHFAAGKAREAATLLHQSNYYRKALHDLLDKIHAA